jgi:hypothetical protein
MLNDWLLCNTDRERDEYAQEKVRNEEVAGLERLADSWNRMGPYCDEATDSHHSSSTRGLEGP